MKPVGAIQGEAHHSAAVLIREHFPYGHGEAQALELDSHGFYLVFQAVDHVLACDHAVFLFDGYLMGAVASSGNDP